MRKALFLLAIALLTIGTFAQDTTQGTLYAVNKKGGELGACPLKNTVVKADISGFLARVRVKQEFENSFAEAIEAVYTFPLSQNGAVDDMTMTIGTRVIRGKIMKREEARQVYETAKAAGQTASLLDQERANIFTQAVANIMPGEKVVIEISYVETLKYEDGSYEFVFPMTVGPRYIPGSVTDASKIKPPVAETRAGHDISVEVNLNAVSVYVTINESGQVVSAEPVSGHPLLKAAAVQAAKLAKFAPTMLSGKAVKTLGVVTYNFIDPKTASVSASAGNLAAQTPDTKPPTAEMIREWAIKEKVHSWVYSLIIRLQKGETTPGPNEKAFVSDGKALVQIVLREKSPEALERLKALGFEVESAKDGINVFGRIAIEKLAELVEEDAVKFVLPRMQ
ncbi:MAG: VIT domain-containing protein [Pyrinomonadaceae bacterium]